MSARKRVSERVICMKKNGHPNGLWLSYYFDGELRPPTAARIRRHVERCARCRGVLRDYRKVNRLMRMAAS